MIKTLGPKQLAWLRDNVPHFSELEQRTIAARLGGIEPRRGLAEDQQQPTENTS